MKFLQSKRTCLAFLPGYRGPKAFRAVKKIDKIIIESQLPHFCGPRCVEAEAGLDSTRHRVSLNHQLSAAQQCQLLPIKKTTRQEFNCSAYIAAGN